MASILTNGKIEIPYQFIPREYQLPLFEAMDSGRYSRYFLRWCRRAGKDKSCVNATIKKMLERVGAYFYLFPSYAQGRKAMWEGRDRDGFALIDHFPAELIKSVNKNEMKIELINGSIFRVIGTDNYDSVRGTNVIGVVFSEYAYQDSGAWDVIRPILAENGGWAIFNSTPNGKNHMYELENLALKNKNWYVSVLQCLYSDLPNFHQVTTKEAINEDRMSGMSEETIEQEYGVSYTVGMQGAYYADMIEKARKDKRIGNFPPEDTKWVDTFWDLGLNDSTSIWFRQTDGRAIIFVDYLEDSNKDLAFYVQALKDKGYRYRTHYLPHDGVHRSIQTKLSHSTFIRTLLQQAGLEDDVQVADRVPQKKLAIDAVRGRFSRYFFNEALMGDALMKLSLYHRKWDKQKDVFLDYPVHDWTSHCADALSTEALTADINEPDLMWEAPKLITHFDPFGDH